VNLVSRLDGYQRRHRWVAVPIAAVYKFVDDQGGYLAALITYYGFLSLFPLLLIFSTVLGFVLPANPVLQQQLLESALGQFPIIGDQLRSSAQPLRGSGSGLAIGILVALYGGLGVAVAIQNAFNQVWGVPVHRRLGLGVLLTTALSALVAVGERFGVGARVGAVVLAVGINTALFLLAFHALTARRVGFREVLPGAVLAAVAWQILQSVGAAYVGYELRGTGQVYGLFGIVLGLLAWIYVEAVVVVFAAELNAVIAKRLWPRALLAPFVEDVDLTRADRRSYESYASTQQYRKAETIDVEFHDTADEPDDDRQR
jgi:membrane protein